MELKKHIVEELADHAPGLARLAPGMPYKAPAGYFENLAAIVLARIKTEGITDAEEEIRILSPLLSGIKKEMPYKAPENYFENLATQTPVKTEAPVRKISFGRKIFRYAAAAIITGIIAITVWYNVAPVKTTTSLAKTEITETPQQLLQEVNAISDDEIENYIEGNISSYEFQVTKEEIKEEDITLMLMEISDNELETYLN